MANAKEELLEVIRTDRGWGGHFICAERCLFIRNTLLSFDGILIVISTVGQKKGDFHGQIEPIGFNRYFETMAFHALNNKEVDMDRPIAFESDWAVAEVGAYDKANDMHERVIEEITEGLLNGDKWQ